MSLTPVEQKRLEDLRVKQGLARLSNKEQDEMINLINKKKKPAQDSAMFTVDVEFKDGRRVAPAFVSQSEAVAYAGQMAQDSAVALSSVRGLDAITNFAKLSDQQIEDRIKDLSQLRQRPSNYKEEVASARKELEKREAARWNKSGVTSL